MIVPSNPSSGSASIVTLTGSSRRSERTSISSTLPSTLTMPVLMTVRITSNGSVSCPIFYWNGRDVSIPRRLERGLFVAEFFPVYLCLRCGYGCFLQHDLQLTAFVNLLQDPVSLCPASPEQARAHIASGSDLFGCIGS